MEIKQESPILSTLKSALEAFRDIRVAIVYGSAAHDRLRPHSDVDIAVAGHEALAPECLVDISIHASRAIRREVDILDLRVTKGLIFYETMSKGIVLFARDTELLTMSAAPLFISPPSAESAGAIFSSREVT